MSEENVEAFKRGVAAWNRGDIDAALVVLDPDVEMAARGRKGCSAETQPSTAGLSE
jgi:ABC-type taurine transport system substrate-binding protein